MSPRGKTKRKLVHIEDESEDLFNSPKKSQKSPARKTKKSDVVEDETLFSELVTKAGYVLMSGDQANMLKCDLAIFKKKLQWSLKSHRFYKMPEIIEVFIKDLENHLEDPLRLKWALLYTQTEAGCESARGGQQDSLIRLCLNIEELQPALIKLLTEKFFEVAYDDQSSNSVDIPCLILANLKWLDYVVDPEVLTTKVIELLEGSPLKIQREVITFVPHIVDDANHPEIATVLCKLYEQKRELTAAILDTLGDLTLEPKSFEDVHHSVLKTLHAVRAEQLPIVTKFLLHNTPQSVAYQVVSDMREKISLPGDYIGSSQRTPNKRNTSKNGDDDVAAYEILVFAKIKMAVLLHKFLTNAWLKAIQDVDDVASVRPLDFLLLIVVYEAVPSRQRPIESIFRNKIRTRLFSDAMIEKTFVNHKAVLKEYFSSVIKIASLLLRSCEPLINQAAAAIYRSAFVSMEGHQKQEVILSLLGHLGDNSTVRSAVLSTLSSLAHSNTLEMSKYAIFFKSSLDLVDILNMGEIKHLLDVVSHLAYSDASHAALQDELAILVRKQLSHVELKYKLIGVINAVFCLKNIANTDDSHMTNSRSSGSELDSSALKEAENLLLLVLSSTTKSSTATALFMDELASITLKEGLNAKLEEWICDRMTNDFQDVYVLDIEQDTQPPDDLLPLGIRWNLEVCEEDKKIALNLAPMVIRLEQTRVDPFDVEGSLVYMTTQFRLLRMLESRLHDGDLSNIDALLGCPIYAPSEEVYDKFDSLSPKEQHAALSCLFYIANWFRELINAFVTQKDKDCKVKVYSRLRQLIEIEKLIWQKLPKCHSYTPPLAVYDVDTSMLPPLLNFASKKKGKRGRKPTVGKGKKGKGKGKENTEATQIGTQPNSQSITQLKSQQSQPAQDEETTDLASKEASEVDRNSCRPFLRELHIDVFALMFRKLGIETSSQSGTQLTPAELEFLLTDLNSKLSHIFASSSKRTTVLGHGEHRDIGFSHIDLFNPAEIAQRVVTYFKPICHHLETISGFFQNMIAESDGVMDSPVMYSDQTQPLIVANSLLFTTLAIFFSWSGLQKEENNHILINALRTIAKRLEGDTVNSMEQEGLTSVAFGYLSNFQGSIINLETARTLVQCLVNFLSFPCSENLSEKLVEVVEDVLKREWYTKGGEPEKGAAYNQHIYSLLEIYFKNSGATISYVDTLCSVGLGEFLEASGRNPQSETFPTLNKGTLGIFYRSMMCFLVTGTKKSLSSLGSASLMDKEKCLETWSTAIKIFHILVTMLKTHDSKTLLCPCLKYSRSFLELFLRSAMPVLDSCLLVHNQEVTVLLKNLQGSTRLLQHVCTHSKVAQDTSLTRFVPLLKKSLEMLVYRVKAMLVLNKCSEAFWMGNLKNRDLKGEEILSQSMREESEAEDGEEEEVEEEDNQSDVELDEEEEPKPAVEATTSSSNYSVSF